MARRKTPTSEPTLNNQTEPTFNSEEFRDLAHNAMSMRSDLLRKFMDPRRDYDKECGYPETTSIISRDYKKIYERDPIAARVNDCLPDECWKIQPTVYEDENTETTTEFEEAWDNLGRTLRGGSFYQDEAGSPIWEYLSRVDKLSGIGSFGILMLGLNDLKPGETLEKPVEGYLDWMPGLKESEAQDMFGTEAEYEKPLTSPQEESTQRAKGEVKLLFIRVFDESLVDIATYDSNVNSPRYGQPKMYDLTFINPDDQSKGGVGLPLSTQRVHWTRVIHVADNLSASEVFGDPRMRTVWNRLIDLTKLYGGSAEMYWKGAFPGISLNIDPKMGGDIQVDTDGIRDAMWKYTNSLQRWFALAGVSATSLSPQVVDPTQQINVQVEAICVDLAIPKRIFMGSERGELASSQDAGSWNDRLMGRCKGYLTPRLIVPFVDRLIFIGILPTPKGYSVSWPNVGESRAQKIANGSAMLSALGTYTSMGLETVIELKDVYVRFLGMEEEEADAILENRTRTLEQKQAEADEQAAMAQLEQLQGINPEGDDESEEEPTEEAPPEEAPEESTTNKARLILRKLNR